jgi:homoserine dehydrogenase
VRDPFKVRPVNLAPGLVTPDALAIAIDPGIDVIVEVMGGSEPAHAAILAALGDNKSVVTANKELLAGIGAGLLDDPGSDLHYEASVCGAIPIVRTLKEYCSADRIEGFTGIFSGTCNFVLSQMTRTRCSFEEALVLAQHLGFAEADPAADIDGFDSAAKVALLARIAFSQPLTIEDVDRRGIAGIGRQEIDGASSDGLVYRLVGGARRVGERIDLWVRPELVPNDDAFARVEGTENAVFVETARAGSLRLFGTGAGGEPTAAAIVSDLITVARTRVRARRVPVCR